MRYQDYSRSRNCYQLRPCTCLIFASKAKTPSTCEPFWVSFIWRKKRFFTRLGLLSTLLTYMNRTKKWWLLKTLFKGKFLKNADLSFTFERQKRRFLYFWLSIYMYTTKDDRKMEAIEYDDVTTSEQVTTKWRVRPFWIVDASTSKPTFPNSNSTWTPSVYTWASGSGD